MAIGNSTREINMTPLIDVLLVLLIIFMVITPITPKGLEAKISQDSPAVVTEPDQSIVVSVAKDGSLRVNQEQVSIDSLRARLKEILGRRATRVCFVSGAGELEYEAVAQVLDIARDEGLNQVALMRMVN
jgi:biopolymer transport protein TolR